MTTAKQRWQDANRQILLALDLRAEYSALGLNLKGRESGKGWIPCQSADVAEDREPSAGINVQDGPFLGRYKDFRSGRSVGLFDFAARARFAGDWRAARNYYAQKTGVKLPGGEEGDERALDRLDLSEPTVGTLLLFAKGKPGVTLRSLQEVGVRGGRWPKGLPAERTNHLLCAPMYGTSALMDLDATAWHVVAANPRLSVRKYQGEGREEALHKVLTLGDYGLMNEDGLSRLAEADVVNLVEGLSDLLACQAVLGPWRDADPDNRKHVVLSAGGCSYHPKPEWIPHFAGKEVRVWFDIGDTRNEGQIGAAVWVAALAPVARAVRNVQLPLGEGGGKNDLRAWLVSGNDYADMDGYAATFEPIAAEDRQQQMSVEESILANLGLLVIGEHVGSQAIEVFSNRLKKTVTIRDIDKLSIAKLIQCAGVEAVTEHVHDGREAQPGKARLNEVKNAIAAAAAQKSFHGEELLGAGCWLVDGKILLVKSRESGVISPSRDEIERFHVPFFGSRLLDIGHATGDWVDFGELQRLLIQARDMSWRQRVIEEGTALFGNWYWRQAAAPQLITGLVAASWVQTLWDWRPEVFVTGNSDTGKSLLIEETLSYGVFGRKMALYVQRPTEAAIRQHMLHHGRVLVVDEFEHSADREKVLKLCRTASQGGYTIRGTADQRGAKYRLQHIVWFAAIDTGLSRAADRNRYLVLDLEDIPPERRGTYTPPPAFKLHELGQRLLALALWGFHDAQRMANELKARQFAGVPGRIVESFAVPWAILAVALGQPLDLAAELMGEALGQWDFSGQAVKDEVSLLQEIMTAEVVLDGGRRSTVSQLLADDYFDPGTLSRVGVRRIEKRSEKNVDLSHPVYLWFCQDVVKRMLLKPGADFHGQTIDQYLLRIPGAKRSRQRLGGQELFWGVEIPNESIATIMGHNREGE